MPDFDICTSMLSFLSQSSSCLGPGSPLSGSHTASPIHIIHPDRDGAFSGNGHDPLHRRISCPAHPLHPPLDLGPAELRDRRPSAPEDSVLGTKCKEHAADGDQHKMAHQERKGNGSKDPLWGSGIEELAIFVVLGRREDGKKRACSPRATLPVSWMICSRKDW